MACKASGLIGHPSSHNLEGLLSSNNPDCPPITIYDVKNDHVIFGPDLAVTRGKTVRHKMLSTGITTTLSPQ